MLLLNNIVSRRVLSFALRDEHEDSYFLIGEPDYSLAASKPRVNSTIPLINKGRYFQVALTSFDHGSTTISSAFQEAIIDTGASHVFMP